MRLYALLALCSLSCAGGLDDIVLDASDVATEQALAGANARGPIPAGLPARVMVGLFEETGQNWMSTSGVAWDARYRYFTKGWVNNWGWGGYDGSFGLDYLKDTSQRGYVPAIQYYQLFGEPGGGEAQTLAKVQTAATMKSYFGDFKILMQRVKEFGKPTLVLLEADGFAFLQQQSQNNPGAYAAIAASGMPELASLPNTVAGFGLAFLQLRAQVGASNAILGIHISGWASGKDFAYGSVSDPLQPEVDKVYAFLAPLGLAANATGAQFDVLVGDPLDRDSDFYRLVLGQGDGRWWDASDAASVNSRSFNRYAEWLRLWNIKAQKRWVLWQIPLGNSNHKNVYNNGGPAEGYKDNRPEYFFGSGTAHLEKFADAGVIALLFGAGAGGQSSYANDSYSDGQLFMKSRAGVILNAGGVPLATSQSTCNAVNGSGTGLSGAYFANKTLGGSPVARSDARVDFAWGNAAPLAGIPADGFSVRWTGQLSPRFGGVTAFHTTSDDGVRLWVNGQLIIDNWTDPAPTENTGLVSLIAGQRYDVKLEYYENAGGATARLSWSSACEAKQVVPSAQLYPSVAVPSDGSRYGFESSTQGWQTSGSVLAAPRQSSTRPFAGVGALEVPFTGVSGAQSVSLGNPAVPPGATVTFHVFIPSGSQITAIQPYVLEGAAGGWAWHGNYRAIGSLTAGAWNTLTVAMPASSTTPQFELGVQLVTSGGWSGSAFVDAVDF